MQVSPNIFTGVKLEFNKAYNCFQMPNIWVSERDKKVDQV